MGAKIPNDEESAFERPSSIKVEDRLGNPLTAVSTPLAMGGFATTLMALSLSMMGFRGVQTQTVFIGNLCLVAGLGLVISAQWEMVKGNTFAYTVLMAFGFFYGGYGVIMIPSLGVMESYGGPTPEYYNGMGFFVLIWAVFDIFFIIASTQFNLVYVLIFVTLEFCFSLDAASWFARADGNIAMSDSLMVAAGAFAFVASVLGYYTLAHYLCEEALPFPVPMGDLSRVFKRRAKTV